MLLTLIFTSVLLYSAESADVDKNKSYVVLPVPLGLPFRNERAEQCWLRIEDAELIETVAIYCYIAQSYLRSHIHEYNTRKMSEDEVDVSLWNEEPRPQEDILPKLRDPKENVVDWKLTTVWDPITRMRLYVSRNAYCRLIMYNRDAETNYKVDCDKILYFVNNRTNGATLRGVQSKLPVIMLIGIMFLVL